MARYCISQSKNIQFDVIMRSSISNPTTFGKRIPFLLLIETRHPRRLCSPEFSIFWYIVSVDSRRFIIAAFLPSILSRNSLRGDDDTTCNNTLYAYPTTRRCSIIIIRIL